MSGKHSAVRLDALVRRNMDLRISSEDGVIQISRIFEEGGFVIKLTRDGKFLLFEIPLYGGKERFHASYVSVYDALEVAEKWT